jgi:hypothetical protein
MTFTQQVNKKNVVYRIALVWWPIWYIARCVVDSEVLPYMYLFHNVKCKCDIDLYILYNNMRNRLLDCTDQMSE